MRMKSVGIALTALIALVGAASAQNPTGTLSGNVLSADAPLPGVLVSVTSAALQGTRTAMTTANGAYILPFLPPGDYQIKFELDGFLPLERAVKVPAGQAVQLDAEMSSATVSEEIMVTGSLDNISTTPQAAVTYEKAFIEELPVARDVRNIALLAPAVSATGPGRNIAISGNMSFENLFLVNGVVVNENLRGQAFPLFVEDAILETTVSSSGISAEYGRFAGGVVNTITKSGGNNFSGSLRVNYENDSWVSATALTPSRVDKINPIYEATAGGFLMRDRMWFFVSGRDFDRSSSLATAALTRLAYANDDSQTRLEGKLTFSLNPKHRIVGTYLDITETDGGNSFGTILDLASVVQRELPQRLQSINYTGIMSANFFVEAQFSEREFAFVNSGAPFTDRIKGTLLLTPSNQRWWSPTFCGVCGPEQRDNENSLVKGSWFLSTGSTGSHELAFGYDTFTDVRLANNHQSGSDFRLLNVDARLNAANVLAPVVTSTTIIQYNPIELASEGTDFKTNSVYVNDRWNLNGRWSFNLGARYDQNDGADAAGNKVVDDAKISPRLGMVFDAKGDSSLIVNASLGRYVAAVANNQADSSSKAGQPGTITWRYGGPAVNATGTAVDTATGVRTVFDWFDSVGGVNNTTFLRTISLPGLTARVADTLASPNTDEAVIGFSQRLGGRGLLRVDVVHRESTDFYMTVNSATGEKVRLPSGALADVSFLRNDGDFLVRDYDGIHSQFRYRIADRLDIGGNYTLSRLNGNFDGETAASGPVPGAQASFREYKAFARHAPEGDLAADQRHRGRAWVTWTAIDTDRHRLTASLLQSYASGTPYGAVGAVDTRPFVTNPGYSVPPASVTYYFTERDAFRTDNITRTDIAFNYSFKWSSIEVFLQPEVINAFNEDGVEFVSGAVLDATNAPAGTLSTFNPFTTTTVEGVHWSKAASFGKPQVAADFQTPRTIRFSVGVRF